MSNYSWAKYNSQNQKLSSKIIKFNQLNNINFVEEGIYNHIRDIFCLSILFLKPKKPKTKILDYGSNILALSNIKSKIKIKSYEFNIFDPFFKKKKIKKPFKVNFINHTKKLKQKKFDIINFGSSIQYLENLNILNKQINFKSVKTIIITHTPFTLSKKKYVSKQSNHLNLIQHIYSISYIKKFYKKMGFELIFKSRNEDKYIACKNKKKRTYSLNLIFIKK
jgi:hypothetical protein